MAQYTDGEFVINHSTYKGNYGGDDKVCQVKQHGVEMAHCTWHPGNSVPNRHTRSGQCPYRNGTYCLDR